MLSSALTLELQQSVVLIVSFSYHSPLKPQDEAQPPTKEQHSQASTNYKEHPPPQSAPQKPSLASTLELQQLVVLVISFSYNCPFKSQIHTHQLSINSQLTP